VFDARLAERSWLGRPVLQALAAGPSPIGWALSTDDLDLDRAEMNAAGASLDPARPGERRRPDGGIVRWRLGLPPAIDLARPFLIEHDRSAAEWTAGDRAARAAAKVRLRGLAVPVVRIEGLPGAADGVTVGDQVVGLAGPGADRPIVSLAGVPGGPSSVDALGCRWLLE
jgi:hypothetical protein